MVLLIVFFKTVSMFGVSTTAFAVVYKIVCVFKVLIFVKYVNGSVIGLLENMGFFVFGGSGVCLMKVLFAKFIARSA